MDDLVILVDKNDRVIGSESKLKAHKESKLHRAFSIFVFNSKGDLLLQKRSHKKYHSAGLWSNACCSHPRPEETTIAAAHRRLVEEMGFDCDLKEIFSFIYKVELENGFFEHEFDHVLVGKFDGLPTANPDEVDDIKWIGIDALKKDIEQNPDSYTYWLKKCYDEAVKKSLIL